MRLHSGCWPGLQCLGICLDCRICFQAPPLDDWQPSQFCQLFTRGPSFSPSVTCLWSWLHTARWRLSSEGRETKISTSSSLTTWLWGWHTSTSATPTLVRRGRREHKDENTRSGDRWERLGGWLPQIPSVSGAPAVVMICHHSICSGLSFGFSCVFPCPTDFFKWLGFTTLRSLFSLFLSFLSVLRCWFCIFFSSVSLKSSF